ncbi:MAG: hypothetical protein KC766_15045, partial [Myxococcales bacterium]|nr:hypothetical protein [Myxococcales bacterium]
DCSGVPKDEDVVDCPATCAVDQCNRAGISEPQCVAGRCVAGYECDASKVTCAQPTPQCPAGEVAAVQGGCWTGTCVPAVECRSVTQCNDCTGGNTACAAYETQLGPENHCVEIPAVCKGAATCECMGPSVCVQGFDLCEDFSGIRGVRCGCPTC